MFKAMYITELPLRAVEGVFLDEIRLTSVLGHFIILGAYDRKEGNYVPLAKVKERPGKYMFGFVAPTETKLMAMRGYMEGPKIEKDAICYTFQVGKRKGYLKVNINSDEKTTLNISLSLPEKMGVKLMDSQLDVDSHIVLDHIIPYLKEIENREFYHSPTMSFKVHGRMSDLIERMKTIGGKKVIKATMDGRIVKVFVNEGKVDCVAYEDGQIYLGEDAMLRVNGEAQVDAIVYSVPVEDIVMTMV